MHTSRRLSKLYKKDPKEQVRAYSWMTKTVKDERFSISPSLLIVLYISTNFYSLTGCALKEINGISAFSAVTLNAI